jgi:hypothetical protein
MRDAAWLEQHSRRLYWLVSAKIDFQCKLCMPPRLGLETFEHLRNGNNLDRGSLKTDFLAGFEEPSARPMRTHA